MRHARALVCCHTHTHTHTVRGGGGWPSNERLSCNCQQRFLIAHVLAAAAACLFVIIFNQAREWLKNGARCTRALDVIYVRANRKPRGRLLAVASQRRVNKSRGSYRHSISCPFATKNFDENLNLRSRASRLARARIVCALLATATKARTRAAGPLLIKPACAR